MADYNVSRREILKYTGGAAGTAALAGTGAADELVEVNVGYSAIGGRRAAQNAAANVKRDFGFRAMTIQIARAAAEQLANRSDVRYVELNGTWKAFDQTTPYGIEQVDADVAIDDGNTGGGVSVAIIDTGIDAQHETLESNLGAGWASDDAACTTSCGGGPFGGGNNIDECLEEWDDDNDHGTHCAGTAAAADNGAGVLGVAPDATLHAVKVLQCDGGGSYDDIAAGIEWSADQGHDVQNMSLGGDDSSVVKDAVEYAAGQGVVIVAAAGNDGPCTDCVSYPAAYEEVIAVSATDENDDLADFSSTGPEVELAAPGVDTLSTVPRDDYDEFSGTSMASPHVAGGAAQVIADGTTDRDEVRSKLQESADDIGLDDTEQGHGRLNVADALDVETDDGGDDEEEEDEEDDGSDEDCVDAANWPDGSGMGGYENIDEVNLDDGAVVESSGDNDYEDFTCPDVVSVAQGGSFEVEMAYSDGGYDSHYANVFVDWDGNEDWSTAQETVLMENVDDDSQPATATVEVPSDAATGGTLCRVRLSWSDFDDADDTDEYGEVNDFTVYVE